MCEGWDLVKTMLEETIAQLLQHYAAELTCYREICALAAMGLELCDQKDLTGADTWQKFAGILSRRAEVITIVSGKIEQRKKIEASLARQLGLSQWDAASLAAALHTTVPTASSLKLAALLSQLAALLQQIATLDRQTEQQLEAAREQLKGEMAQLRGWKRANGAYRPPGRQEEGYLVEHNR